MIKSRWLMGEFIHVRWYFWTFWPISRSRTMLTNIAHINRFSPCTPPSSVSIVRYSIYNSSLKVSITTCNNITLFIYFSTTDSFYNTAFLRRHKSRSTCQKCTQTSSLLKSTNGCLNCSSCPLIRRRCVSTNNRRILCKFLLVVTKLFLKLLKLDIPFLLSQCLFCRCCFLSSDLTFDQSFPLTFTKLGSLKSSLKSTCLICLRSC